MKLLPFLFTLLLATPLGQSGSCPSGYTPSALTHAASTHLNLNQNDIAQGASVCIDKQHIDDGKSNGTGNSFYPAWSQGKRFVLSEDNLHDAKRTREPSSINPKSTLSEFTFHTPVCSLQLPFKEKNASTEDLTDNPNEDRMLDPETDFALDPNKKIQNTADQSEKVARELSHEDLIDSVLKTRRSIYQAATNDEKAVNEFYHNIPFPLLGDYLKRADRALSKAAEALESTQTGMDESELDRFQKIFQNAEDKSRLALRSFQQEMNHKKNTSSDSPFSSLLNAINDNFLSRTPELAEIIGSPPTLSAEGLTNRLLLFYGLPKSEQEKISKDLKLIENPTLILENGKKIKLKILHNGYLLGSSSTGIDCSTLASLALPIEMRKTKFTSLDFRVMWIFRKTGKMPKQPKYTKARAELIQKYAQAFVPVNLYSGERLTTGDLLVYRLPWDTLGHVFIIRNYNPSSLLAEVLEASQSAGTIRERTFPLSTDPHTQSRRLFRPGLFTLRLKPLNNKGCAYKGKS